MPKPTPKLHYCDLCERAFEDPGALTEHHVLPRSQGGTVEHVRPFCRLCHGTVHATYTNQTLGALYFTTEALREAPELQPYLRWVRRQPAEKGFKTKRRNQRS
jgi:hypothetical protein